MSEEVNDIFTSMRSLVRFKPICNLSFIAEEIRKYGIKTNKTNRSGKNIFFQSSHIVSKIDLDSEESTYPEFGLTSFIDLFNLIGKNEDGADDADITRVWVIAEKLESRRIIEITGTYNALITKEDKPEIPDLFVHLNYVNKNDEDKTIFKSKFATNKVYNTKYGNKLLGIGDYFILN